MRIQIFKTNIRLLRNYLYDYKFFNEFSATKDNKRNKATHRSELIFYYHKIEKGLALPNPRVGFGEQAILYLIDSLEQYVEKYKWDKTSQITLNTLNLYYEFNLRNNNSLNDLNERLEKLRISLGPKSISNEGGVLDVKKSEILKNSSIDFNNFANSRHSIRDFSSEEVPVKLIKEAIKIAQKTPSVCNRQSSIVHIFDNKDKQKQALSFQNGNAGFGDKASKILLITTDAEDFFGAGERNQAFIDGGMFAMSIIYALHSLGIGSCALNLALDYRVADRLKKNMGIEQKEIPIMMIAVGYLPETLKVAASPRKSLDEITKIH
ncbi:nitroreductase [Sporosarcina sp. P13]|nr:nitroreductase [Sporosarcina sp. P13]